MKVVSILFTLMAVLLALTPANAQPAHTFNCCPGNINGIDIVDLSDLSALVSYLTGGGFVIPCQSSVDVNGVGILDLSDLSALVSYLTGGGYVLRSCSPNTITDIDGNVYQTVTIGSQVWMTENLRVTRYRNGDPIPQSFDDQDHSSTAAFQEFNNDLSTVASYGLQYNWFAVTDSRSVAPYGWHVASDSEWQTMVNFLGGDAVAGGKLKEAGTRHWPSPNTGATNESGFSAVPTVGGVNVIVAHFWTTSVFPGNFFVARTVWYGDATVHYIVSDHGSWYYSVRCVRDF